jgi:hypothetical protein
MPLLLLDLVVVVVVVGTTSLVRPETFRDSTRSANHLKNGRCPLEITNTCFHFQEYTAKK